MKKIFNDFYSFVYKTEYEKKIKLNFKEFMCFLFFFLVSSFFLTIVLYFYLKNTALDISLKSTFFSDFDYKTFLKIVIIVPVLEEFIFRSILVSNRLSLSAFLFAMLYLMFAYWGIDVFLNLTISLLIVSIQYYTNLRIPKMIYNKSFKVIIYSFSILFAIYHIWNFNITPQVLFLSPLLLFPKFFIGISLSFIRVRFGLMFSIISHSLHNLVPVLIYLSVSK